MKTAVAYFRTSSATNVGDDKDSLKRQQEAVASYAKRHRLTLAREYYDAAVSGAGPSRLTGMMLEVRGRADIRLTLPDPQRVPGAAIERRLRRWKPDRAGVAS